MAIACATATGVASGQLQGAHDVIAAADGAGVLARRTGAQAAKLGGEPRVERRLLAVRHVRHVQAAVDQALAHCTAAGRGQITLAAQISTSKH